MIEIIAILGTLGFVIYKFMTQPTKTVERPPNSAAEKAMGFLDTQLGAAFALVDNIGNWLQNDFVEFFGGEGFDTLKKHSQFFTNMMKDRYAMGDENYYNKLVNECNEYNRLKNAMDGPSNTIAHMMNKDNVFDYKCAIVGFMGGLGVASNYFGGQSSTWAQNYEKMRNAFAVKKVAKLAPGFKWENPTSFDSYQACIDAGKMKAYDSLWYFEGSQKVMIGNENKGNIGYGQGWYLHAIEPQHTYLWVRIVFVNSEGLITLGRVRKFASTWTMLEARKHIAQTVFAADLASVFFPFLCTAQVKNNTWGTQ